jgi:hypothetical protein
MVRQTIREDPMTTLRIGAVELATAALVAQAGGVAHAGGRLAGTSTIGAGTVVHLEVGE